jgi:hypothetical protein
MRYEVAGFCPICEAKTTFVAEHEQEVAEQWMPHLFRAALCCVKCKGPPRERAIAHVLTKLRPNWRDLAIHESSPGGWAFSYKLRREAPGYVASQYDPTFPFGQMHSTGLWRNEDLEAQTFGDETFDIVVTQDVFEHLFNPGRAAREICRTLKPGGLCLMTVPVVNHWGTTQRRASLKDGQVVHHLPEQYHGNPVGDGRSLVTVDWSYGIGAYLTAKSGVPFSVLVIDDMSMGIRDPYNTLLVATKEPLADLQESLGAGEFPALGTMSCSLKIGQ